MDIAALTAWGATHNDNIVEQVLTSSTWSDGQGPNQITLPCGRYYLSNIKHPSTLTIRAEGRTVLFVDGDVEIGGGINLEIADDAEIDLFIAYDTAVRHSEDCDEREPSLDAGNTSSDIHVSDSGEPNPDAEAIGCTHCFECPHQLGCVIPEGETMGQCSECQTDLDCCAPAICVVGGCEFSE